MADDNDKRLTDEALYALAQGMAGTEMDANAGSIYDLFVSFKNAGFSQSQSMYLVAASITGNPLNTPIT